MTQLLEMGLRLRLGLVILLGFGVSSAQWVSTQGGNKNKRAAEENNQELYERQATMNSGLRYNIPMQSVAEILASTKPAVVEMTPAKSAGRAHIPIQSLSQILQLPPSSYNNVPTENPIEKLNSMLKRNQESILGLTRQADTEPIQNYRVPYQQSDTTHKRSLPTKQIPNQIESKPLRNPSEKMSKVDILEKPSVTIINHSDSDKAKKKPIINNHQHPTIILPNQNRDKVFSILSSTAKSKALYELSKPVANNPMEEDLFVKSDVSNPINIEKSWDHIENDSRDVINIHHQVKPKRLNTNFQFIPNFENAAIAQLLNLPQNDQSQIKITLENLENIIKFSQDKDRDEVVGILGMAYSATPAEIPIPSNMAQENLFPGTPAGAAGFPDENKDEEPMLAQIMEENKVISEMKQGLNAGIISENDSSDNLLLRNGIDDNLHVKLLTQLPPEMLSRLEAEVPSLSEVISLAKNKQTNLNRNIGFRQRLLNQPARFNY